MAKDINFYVTKKNADLLKYDWNRKEIAPIAPIESRYLFDMVSVSLLRLYRCECGFEYILIVSDHFKNSHNHVQPVINQPKQQLVNSLTISSYSLVSPPETIMIEVMSLETIYLIICTNYSETSQLRISQIADMPWIVDKMFSPNLENLW